MRDRRRYIAAIHERAERAEATREEEARHRVELTEIKRVSGAAPADLRATLGSCGRMRCGARDRAQLVVLAYESGLVVPRQPAG